MSVFKSLREYYPFPSFRSGGELICDKIEKAVLKTTNNDIRAKSGLERGGRSLAYSVINSVIDA